MPTKACSQALLCNPVNPPVASKGRLPHALRRLLRLHGMTSVPTLAPVSAQVIARHANICKQLHMPAQSGSTDVLRRMRRCIQASTEHQVKQGYMVVCETNLSCSHVSGATPEKPTMRLLDESGA